MHVKQADLMASTDVDSCSLRDSLLHHLHYTLAKDQFSATPHDDYLDGKAWTRKSLINTARSGRFSSDRTVLIYAREVRGLTGGRSINRSRVTFGQRKKKAPGSHGSQGGGGLASFPGAIGR